MLVINFCKIKLFIATKNNKYKNTKQPNELFGLKE